MIEYECPECGESVESPERSVGQTGLCPTCKATAGVPPRPGTALFKGLSWVCLRFATFFIAAMAGGMVEGGYIPDSLAAIAVLVGGGTALVGIPLGLGVLVAFLCKFFAVNALIGYVGPRERFADVIGMIVAVALAAFLGWQCGRDGLDERIPHHGYVTAVLMSGIVLGTWVVWGFIRRQVRAADKAYTDAKRTVKRINDVASGDSI